MIYPSENRGSVLRAVMAARGLFWLKTVGAFPFEENQSGIFHFGKPEACFLYENQGVYLLVRIVMALYW